MQCVLLLNLGGPASEKAVGPFLRSLFSDPMIIQLPGGGLVRPALARLIAAARAPKVRRYYRAIGGGSPLLRLTEAQSVALTHELGRRGREGVVVRPVMRYTEPRAHTVLSHLREAGIREAIALPLYPQECMATTGSSLADLERARGKIDPGLKLFVIRGFHDHPGYIDAVAGRVAHSLRGLDDGERSRAILLFSAHGVPENLSRRGDPYIAQVHETVEAILARIDWRGPRRLAFQSRTGPVRWVGPGTDEVLVELAGAEAVVVVPVSFVSDHIETLYEIDILYAALARRLGIRRFVRTESLNSVPAFIGALADMVESLPENC